jgi:hypothetical protein
MNEKMVLDWLLEDTRKNADGWYRPIRQMETALYELNNQQEKPLPSSLPRREADMIRVLRKHFNNNVTYISLVLNHHFPDRYLFYRVSSLEQEIFAGFNFLKPVVPQLAFSFSRVGGTGFSRYLQLNQALLDFARTHWPKDREPQKKLAYFLYQGLGRLFQEKPTVHHRRYWVMATKERFFEELDAEKEAVWSGRKEMQAGDLAFIYRADPVKAMTDIYRVQSEPRFDPWGGWGGFWVSMEKVCAIEPIPFAEMKSDAVVGQYSIVKRNFVGTITEPVPPVIYNGLLEKISSAVRARYKLEPEKVAILVSPPGRPEEPPELSQLPTLATPELSGRFALEADFEEKVIVPLLKQWNFKHHAQYGCPAWIGSQEHKLWVDFLVSDDQGPLTLFEDKWRIMGDKELKPAVGQAKSYALLLGLPSFVVASPEGMWLYALDGNQERLEEQISAVRPREQQENEFRDLLLKLKAGRTGYQQPRH